MHGGIGRPHWLQPSPFEPSPGRITYQAQCCRHSWPMQIAYYIPLQAPVKPRHHRAKRLGEPD